MELKFAKYENIRIEVVTVLIAPFMELKLRTAK